MQPRLVITIYSLPTHCLLTIYLLSAHWLLTAYSLSTYYAQLLEEIVTPAPELTGICIGPEQDALFVTEASTNSVYRIPL